MKRFVVNLMVLMLVLCGCEVSSTKQKDTVIRLSDERITVNGKKISEDKSKDVYSANDIVFYLANQGITYGEGSERDEHEQKEADAHTVIHITKPGKYILQGKLSLGQVAIDLGEEASENPEAKVTLVLDNVDITCKVAPAIIFYNVYECGEKEEATAKKDVDTTNAGANVVIADDSVNNINGSYVAKIYKTYELNEAGTEVVDSKKLHKYDAAFYAKQSMNIDGEEKGSGILNIKAENEGLDSELHLTINGGNINIVSGNDGINTNEDNISVTTINGGNLTILCDGSTGEGDGIDSNGWLVINGGSVMAQACATSGDAGIDSDKGIYINGGSVLASGNMLDSLAEGDSYIVFNFMERQKGDETYLLKDASENVVVEYSAKNAFTYLIISDEKIKEGDYTFWKDGTQLSVGKMNNMQQALPQQQMPDGVGNPPEGFDGMQKLEGEPPMMPQADRPQMIHPNQNEGVMPPNGFDHNGFSEEEKTEILTIVKGGNYFRL